MSLVDRPTLFPRPSPATAFLNYRTSAAAAGLQPDIVRRSLRLSIIAFAIHVALVPLALLVFPASRLDRFILLTIFAGAVAAVSRLFLERYRDPLLGHAFAYVVQVHLISITMVFYSYCAAAVGWPMQDALFSAMDKSLGFDWSSWMALIRGHEGILWLASWLYASLDKQLLLAGVAAPLALRFRELQTFSIAWLVCAAITIAISAILPAYSPFHHYGVVAEMRSAMLVPAGFAHIAQVESVRAGAPFDIFADPAGIVTFPSFHAAAAIMLAWLFWCIPLLRWPMIAVNAGMLLATPAIGSHYLVDLIAGIIAAAASIVIANRFCRVEPQRAASGETLTNAEVKPEAA